MSDIDLRSDTVTKPTEEMRDAMRQALVGDDVFGEDPTVKVLEERCAEITGKEAALFVASGTMGNLVSLLTHCQRGESAIVGIGSHIFKYEQGGASTLGGIHLRPIHNQQDGSMSLETIESSIFVEDVHFPRTRLICIENTFNGSPLSIDYTDKVVNLARNKGLSTHLDGARIFNAALAQRCTVKDLTAGIDSIQCCFSKGLGAPAGSIIASSRDFIKEARRWRKAVGGGMRQVGVLAAACIVSLDKMVDRLAEDHENARQLAKLIEEAPGIVVNQARLKTNMVWFDVELPGIDASDFVTLLEEKGIKVLNLGPKTIRAVAHHGITGADIEKVAHTICDVAAEVAGSEQKRAAASR